ncbi:type 4a pilus biogenesis protein PilO [Actinoplanes sp. G11-F43]|uniref:type 4a pilus biogenesis protein PilO n=1 Tax=Actinoplanes sp. G11-F43 TaxID=3424130 RepID=UPI003D32F353
MNTRRIDQLWLFGGLALTVLLVVGGYLLVIKPQYAARDTVQNDTADVVLQLAKEQKKLNELKEQLKNIDEYQTTLATAQKALPYGKTTNQIPEFLKQLQSLGAKYKINVSGYAASAPQPLKDTPSVSALPITLNIDGKIEPITRFLKHLQNEQPRAVLIQSARYGASLGGEEWSLSLSLSAFITSTQTKTVSS